MVQSSNIEPLPRVFRNEKNMSLLLGNCIMSFTPFFFLFFFYGFRIMMRSDREIYVGLGVFVLLLGDCNIIKGWYCCCESLDFWSKLWKVNIIMPSQSVSSVPLAISSVFPRRLPALTQLFFFLLSIVHWLFLYEFKYKIYFILIRIIIR